MLYVLSDIPITSFLHLLVNKDLNGKENQNYFVHKANDKMCICYLGVGLFPLVDNRLYHLMIQVTNFSDIKYGTHRQRVAETIKHTMESNPRKMRCSDGYPVGRLENSERRDWFKNRKVVIS